MKQSKKTIIGSAGVATLIAVFISLASVILIALGITKEYVPLDTATKIFPVVQIVSVFVGCLLSCKLTADNRLLCGGLTTAGYFLVLVGISCLFFDGISGNFWIGLISAVTGWITAILLITKLCNQSGNRRRRKARC